MSFVPVRRPMDTELKNAVIANSITLAIGDAVVPGATTHAGAVTLAGATGLILGVVFEILQLGRFCELSSVTTASDNETTKKYSARYIPTFISLEYTADLSAAAGTTTSSNLLGFFNLTGATSPSTLDETSYTAFGTAGQFWSNGVTSYLNTKVTGHFYSRI